MYLGPCKNGSAEDSAYGACSGTEKHHGCCTAGGRGGSAADCPGQEKEHGKIKESTEKTPEEAALACYFSADKTAGQAGDAIDGKNSLIDLRFLQL